MINLTKKAHCLLLKFKFSKNILFAFLFVSTCLLFMPNKLPAQNIVLNNLGYFETTGVNLLVFSNEYNGMFFDEKTAGIELIHHGVRTATGGAVRLQHTPEQWDLVPMVVSRKIDTTAHTIEVILRYQEFNFDSRVVVSSKNNGFEINVYFDNPLPEKLVGHAGFNMEFLPSAYFEKSYIVDGSPSVFPRYPAGNTFIEPVSNKIKQFAGHTTFDDRGLNNFIIPKPLATGKTIVMAPDDEQRMVTIEAVDAQIKLFDGRNLAQNGWFILRSLLPANKTGKVLTWNLKPSAIQNWKREPVIGFSQAGYIPKQQKVAVIELDANDVPLKTASLFMVGTDGKFVEKFTGNVNVWGKYLRYNYAKFDFTGVNTPGVYFIKYGNYKTNTFIIDTNVYSNIWQPTLDVWFPVQMDHMQVNEAYRVWHGAPYLDDCLQAPVNFEHFDGYKQGPTTGTKYKPLERIPNMAVGGWFDAGDFDIQTGSHNSVVSSFVAAWEQFKVDRDQTFIDQSTRFVDIHRPDGKPDILQQIEHGTLNLVAQVENIGHPVRGIVVPNLHQYHHLGDAVTETDNFLFNPRLKPYQTDGIYSGTPDDRWAFTDRNAFLDYQTSATLAAASRALRGFNNTLADKSLACAKKLLDEADLETAQKNNNNNQNAVFRRGSGLDAVLQLFITTNDKIYADRFKQQIWRMLEPVDNRNSNSVYYSTTGISLALTAIPYFDKEYKDKLRNYIVKYKETITKTETENPYGVPIVTGGWGGSSAVINWSITNYWAHKYFPDIIDANYVYRGLNYIFGCHPYSNLSFVLSVGTRSKKVAYGNNRADFTFIAGGVVPGLILLKPDFLENKDDWPFLWGENECVIGGGAAYIFVANAANELSKITK